MSDTTYYVRGTVVSGKACKILAKNRVGAVIGEYDGYYKPDRGVFVLYPAKNPRYFGKLYKHEVSATIVRRCDNGS